MTTEQTEKLRIARIAAKMSMQVIGEDPETALAIILTALQLVGKSCGLSREDIVHLAVTAVHMEPVEGDGYRAIAVFDGRAS